MTQSEDLSAFLWIVVMGGFTAFLAAFGIGANDVANAYATSVGSKALTIKQACVLAVIFEFAGSVLAGSAVADTIRKGIADYACYEGGYMDSAILMYGNLCVVGSVAIWLALASWLEMCAPPSPALKISTSAGSIMTAAKTGLLVRLRQDPCTLPVLIC
uniref:Phosphate transporter n=1 Tax=Chrysotila carterae TaxID=13221 RepID=A0A7S4BS60_CHRCT